MKNVKARRMTRTPTPKQKAALQQQRREIARELPGLIASDQMRKEARDAPTVSGELRRAIHASPLSLSDIAAKAKISSLSLDEFLTGDRTLRSDVLDRLASILGFKLTAP